MGMYDNFETDPNLETNGIKVDYGDFRVTLAFAGASNKAFAKFAEAKLKPYKRAMDSGTLSQELSSKIMMEIYAKTIVRNWEVRKVEKDSITGEELETWVQGIEAKDGSVMPFNEENVIKTFKALVNLFFDLQEMASKAANYRAIELEDDAKNS